MEYGVQTHNKFAFLDEDVSDPEETLVKAEVEKKAATTVPQPKKSVKLPPATNKDTEKQNRNVNRMDQTKNAVDGVKNGDRGNQDGFNRGDSGQNNRGRPPRQPRPNFQRDKAVDGERPVRPPQGDRPPRNDANENGEVRKRGPRPPGFDRPRGGGAYRGDRGGRYYGQGQGGQRRPPRFQDENQNDENKSKENVQDKSADNFAPTDGWGAAPDDWGTAEPDQQQQKPDNESVEKEVVKTAETGEEEKKEQENETEQIPQEKTYEEYKAELKKCAEEEVHFNTRKPGEGGDQKIYQKLVPLKKTDKKTATKQEQFEDNVQQHKEKREKQLLEINVSFSDPKTRGGGGYNPGRGGRGGEMGPRGERGDRQGGGRGGGGPRGPPRFNQGGPGPSRRPPNPQQGQGSFTLENDQFPALGAAK